MSRYVFPIPADEFKYVELGLTKRELFAALIAQGIMSNVKLDATWSSIDVSSAAVDVTNHLIAELSKDNE